MEEKERFVYYKEQNQLCDKINDELYCLGVEQDKTRLVEFLNLMNEDWWALYERNKKLREENRQLKQSQKQLAISELEKVRDTVECVLDNALKNSSLNQSYYDKLLDEIDNQINKLKGEE